MSAASYAIVILAAGSSSRMGQPKQLLEWSGNSLLRQTALLALQLHHQVVVVLGAGFRKIQKNISDLPVDIVENKQWNEGMSTSLQTALRHACSINPLLEGILILLIDQPHITVDHLRKLVAAGRTSSLAASLYGQDLGVPAFISKDYFEEIHGLTGDRGARTIFRKHQDRTMALPFSPGATDIDTPEDWENFLNENP